MYKLRRRQLSQNFLYNRKLIRHLVGLSSITPRDTVVEIGPGKGFITAELLKIAKRVIAVELDPRLVLHLRRQFPNDPNLTLISGNFLDFPLPREEYKVFANIPFSIEGEIVRKLIDDPHPPRDCFLVIVKELAERLSGYPHENQFSLKHQPWFEFAIIHRFARTDFVPRPRVKAVLWRIRKRDQPLVPWPERNRYWDLIEQGVGRGEPLKFNFRRLLGRTVAAGMFRQLSIDPSAKPSFLTLGQWIKIYTYLRR